jgi:hypothetical protein
MLGMTFDRKGIAYGIAYNSGTLLPGVAYIIARLSAGVFVIAVRKAVFEGGPKTMELGLWLRDQTIFFFEKSHKSVKPSVIEATKILKVLIIIAVRNLRKATVKRKKLDSAKKGQVPLEEQVEDNITPNEASADQTIQT